MLNTKRFGIFAMLALLAATTTEPALAQTSAANCDLCVAAANGDLGRLQQLLDRGANIGATDQGYTPLGWALSRDRFDAALLLADHHADPNVTIPYKPQFSPLGYAASRGDVGLVQSLIKGGADVNARVGASSALALAAQAFAKVPQPQQGSIIRLLLDAGEDPNAVGLDGRAPLSHLVEAASKAPNFAMPLIKILLVHGAEAGPALRFAEPSGNPGLISLLLAYGARINPKDSAVILNDMRQHPELIPRLIDAGAMIDQPNGDHETALTLAVKEGDLGQVKRLLSLGADPNHQDSDGPPYSQLVSGTAPKLEMFRALLDAGMDMSYIIYEPNGQIENPAAIQTDFPKSSLGKLGNEWDGLLLTAIKQRATVLTAMAQYWHPPRSSQDLDPSPDAAKHLAKLDGPAPGSIASDAFDRWREEAGDFLATANAQAAFFAASKGLAALPPIPDAAKQHEATGKALYVKATGPTGALAAAAEYESAARLAPWVAAYHRDLCILYRLGGALTRAYEHCAIYASGHPSDRAQIERQMAEIADHVPYFVFISKD